MLFCMVLNYNYLIAEDNKRRDIRIFDDELVGEDMATTAISSPVFGIHGYDWDVAVLVHNYGTNSATFDDSTYIENIVKELIFHEDFSYPQGWNGANPPYNETAAAYWNVIDSGDGGDGWNNNDWHGAFYPNWGDTIARLDQTPAENQNEWLITPSLNLTGRANVHLDFVTYYRDNPGPYHEDDTAFILGTTDDWATTQVVDIWTRTVGSSAYKAKFTFDISGWADNQPYVKIAFKYVGRYDYDWYLDDVEVYSASYIEDYISGEHIINLPPSADSLIRYTHRWEDPSPGDYLVTSFTVQAGDTISGDDAMSITGPADPTRDIICGRIISAAQAYLSTGMIFPRSACR
jgi:hypothetical protein